MVCENTLLFVQVCRLILVKELARGANNKMSSPLSLIACLMDQEEVVRLGGLEICRMQLYLGSPPIKKPFPYYSTREMPSSEAFNIFTYFDFVFMILHCVIFYDLVRLRLIMYCDLTLLCLQVAYIGHISRAQRDLIKTARSLHPRLFFHRSDVHI